MQPLLLPEYIFIACCKEMLKEIDALLKSRVRILEHVLLLLLKHISSEHIFKFKKRLLQAVGMPVNSMAGA